jgi:hypothetical protein
MAGDTVELQEPVFEACGRVELSRADDPRLGVVRDDSLGSGATGAASDEENSAIASAASPGSIVVLRTSHSASTSDASLTSSETCKSFSGSVGGTERWLVFERSHPAGADTSPRGKAPLPRSIRSCVELPLRTTTSQLIDVPA